MPLPAGTYPIGGPIVPIAGNRLQPTQDVFDADVVMPEGGRWWRVIETDDPNNPYAWSPVSLPLGSAPLNQLLWNPTTRQWEAASGSTTSFLVLTRDNDGNQLVAAITHALRTAGQAFGEPGFSINYPQYRVTPVEATGVSRINNVWPDGAAAPWVWAVAPTHTGWAANYAIRYWTANEGEGRVVHDAGQTAMVVSMDFLRIAGDAFDVARAQLVGTRPDDEGDRTSGNSPWAGVSLLYTDPPFAGAVELTGNP